MENNNDYKQEFYHSLSCLVKLIIGFLIAIPIMFILINVL